MTSAGRADELVHGGHASEAIKGIPGAAAALAYAGALPLVGAALVVVAEPRDAAILFMIVYGGALMAFFGGVRWGVAVMKPGAPTFGSLLGAAAPLLAALPAFAPIEAKLRLVYILIALPLLLLDDMRATRRGAGAPEWHLGVRTPLTMLMEVSFLVALVQLHYAGA